MGRVKQKQQLSTKELMQLTIWGGLLLVILLALVYGLVRAGAVIPVGSGVERHAASAGHGNAADSRP
jgi:branched-subunit amino acid permease